MLQEKMLQTIQNKNLIETNDKIIIGVSGGPDSMCLLDIFNCLRQKLKMEIIVCHINHGIRLEADDETKYVQNYCKEKNITCFAKKVNVSLIAKEQKVGTEEMGRKIRYEFFEEIAKKVGATKIATAHTANDNAETVLMNILRGTGISGLKGIEAKRKASTYTYIRPLLEITRAEIEEYCMQNKLDPKIDKSNLNTIYTRNKIRNELIPYIQKEFNPNIIETINRLSNVAKQEEDYFKQIVIDEFEIIKIGENEKEIILDLKKFNLLHNVLKTKLLLFCINKLVGTTQGISKIHLDDVVKLCKNNIGNKYLSPKKNIKIFVGKGKIFLQEK